MPVHVFTAPDPRTFLERTQRSEFDLVVTPAHFAWLAVSEVGHVPLLTYRTGLRALLVPSAEIAVPGG